MTLVLPPADDPLIRSVRRTIGAKRLIENGQTVLAACSGGADSTALLVLLTVLGWSDGFRVCVGHVNHRLRGEESEADAEWVRRLSEELGLPCQIAVVDVRRLRAERGGSLEEVARSARYNELRAMAKQAGADLIATAHHLDDQAETVLMHIIRGCGLEGLSGIAWGPQDGLIRPLLGTRRDELRAALGRWSVPWREDGSNMWLRFARNQVREVLLPMLETCWNPQCGPALARLAEIASADAEALDAWAESLWPKAVRRSSDEVVILDKSVLQAYPLGIRRRLLRRAAQLLPTVTGSLTFAETERLVGLVVSRRDVVLRRRLHAWASPRSLVLEASNAWRGPTDVNMPGETRLPGWGVVHVSSLRDNVERAQSQETVAPNEFLWPMEALCQPVTIRRWRTGDRIVGRRGGSRLVTDIVRKRKPPTDPRTIVVLEDAERIIWVPGFAATAIPERLSGQEMVAFHWEPDADAPIT